MGESLLRATALQADLERITGQVKGRLKCHLQGFLLEVGDRGLVLRGRSRNYYAKQLAQHIVMENTEMPILANHIEVC